MEIKEQFDSELEKARHSMAHVLAKAIMQLYPQTKLTIGPAIDDGFYYDIDLDHSITPEEYGNIEKKMKEILNKGESFERKVVSKDEALKLFAGNPFKTEIINELPEGEEVSIYYTGDDFFDLCRGPHVESARQLQNMGYKIHSVNGAYWRGSEKNKMLQRVYCYCFKTKKELNDYITMLEEARKRDHNKLGRELEIFTTVDYIGQGLPILLPRGTQIIQTLQRFVEDEEARRGWVRTKTPLMAKSDLYKISGHWDHYKDGM
ncbi:MAG: threonine--tRNA ligase, partial [Clostridia bacterium]|nr:threonine--tRNA ligase [Clostridia bacterium]